MRFLRSILDSQSKHFRPGGRLEVLYPLFEAGETFLFTTGKVTRGASHVRDALDLKRMMMTVVVALLPCVFIAMYNTGYQAHLAIAGGALPLDTWQTEAMRALGYAFAPSDLAACLVHGALYYFPVLLVTFLVGGNCEALFAMVRKHEINEGFLVTGMLFPLILPPTIPLWQVALGVAFGVVIGKEIFGGTGAMTLKVTHNAISSPESADGATLSVSPDGTTTDPSGRAPVPVSRFRSRESEKAMPINDTCGPLFTASSPSAGLQRSLESRLAGRLDVNGSPEYGLTGAVWICLRVCRYPGCERRRAAHPAAALVGGRRPARTITSRRIRYRNIRQRI